MVICIRFHFVAMEMVAVFGLCPSRFFHKRVFSCVGWPNELKMCLLHVHKLMHMVR